MAMPVVTGPDPQGEQRVVIYGMSWDRYVAMNDLLDDHPGVRMTYLRGTLEIMTTSPEHERRKKLIARLVETYAVERRISLNGYGSATFRKQAKERGAEPDECYVVGSPLQEMPDIAIEVVITSGGIDKLEVYRGLGVPEVWFFRDERFWLYRLREGYEPIERSTFLPGLDLAELARFVAFEDQTEAILAYRDTLR